MISRWFHLKEDAIKLRRKGNSIGDIEKSLKIPRSTLSGWFRNIILTEIQLSRLREKWLNALNTARPKAVKWHNQQKELRLRIAQEQALTVLSKLNTEDKSVIELALAMLYLGEGSKGGGTSLGNTDPLILKFFIRAMREIYNLDTSKIRCELHLRADQNPDQVKNYWANKLNMPLSSFTYVSIDQRTAGSPTYPSYNGVCILQCGNIAIQRRLVYLSKLFCDKLDKEWAVSSAGRASA